MQNTHDKNLLFSFCHVGLPNCVYEHFIDQLEVSVIPVGIDRPSESKTLTKTLFKSSNVPGADKQLLDHHHGFDSRSRVMISWHRHYHADSFALDNKPKCGCLWKSNSNFVNFQFSSYRMRNKKSS